MLRPPDFAATLGASCARPVIRPIFIRSPDTSAGTSGTVPAHRVHWSGGL